MESTLIIYSSTDGQTKNICSRIGEFLSNDIPAKIISLSDATKNDIEKYDRVIIGASIRYGKHRKELFEFIETNLDELTKKENAFFSVNVVARKSEKNTPETNPYMQKFLLKTSWVPQRLAVFAGKIDYPKYNFFDKQMIRFIMWVTKGPTNIKNTYEFTDWNKVDSFAKELIT
jgi:menaquinone-dependent protoporphyrinogen oxidase|tara:strand:- start:6988 stop:7509 length:522 start_codon:yes stop_codon:yes gene_type:complete